MYRTETLIVIQNYGQVQSLFMNPNKLRNKGVDCKPILNNGNWLLPLGWEEFLTQHEIEFTVEEIEYYYEDII